jgi:trigger factor
MQMLLQQAAQQYRPEDRERFIEYVRQDAMAQAQLRAPLYEDKVVDFLFDKAEVTERAVTREELEAAIEAEETAPAKPAKKPAAKKAGAKKPADEKAEKPAPKKEAAKVEAKPAAKKAASARKAEEAKPAAKKPAAKKAAAKK